MATVILLTEHKPRALSSTLHPAEDVPLCRPDLHHEVGQGGRSERGVEGGDGGQRGDDILTSDSIFEKLEQILE